MKDRLKELEQRRDELVRIHQVDLLGDEQACELIGIEVEIERVEYESRIEKLRIAENSSASKGVWTLVCGHLALGLGVELACQLAAEEMGIAVETIETLIGDMG